MGNILNNILVVVGLLILIGFGYYLFVLGGSSQLAGSTVSVNEAALSNQQFLRQISELRSNDLSGEIFTDDRFKSFVDFSLPIQESDVGRDNPFESVEASQ